MKKLLFATFLLVGFGVATFAQKGVKVPAAVAASFAKHFPTVKDYKWEKEGGKYEAGFKQNGKARSALFSADGTLEETEVAISVSALPAKALQIAQAKGKIKEAAKITKANGSVVYEAEVKGKDFLFDEKGNLLP